MNIWQFLDRNVEYVMICVLVVSIFVGLPLAIGIANYLVK
jgi:hypothetical protein